MDNPYVSMWQELGLDLAAHDALLNVLGKTYTDFFLTQKNRPDGMGYFDFVMSEVHGLRIKELLDEKSAGRKIIGSYCVFVPEEIVLAANATLVGLCSGADFAMEAVERLLPRNTCALIKSSFGFKLGKVCPYLESADMVVGENTCDGKKKAYETLGSLVNNLYVMDLPQVKSEQGRVLLRAEYDRFKTTLEALTGVAVTAESLKTTIRTVNAKRAAIHRLSSLRKADPAPISGMDALLANQVFFYDNPERFTTSVNKICDELERRIAEEKGVFPAKTPRVLISGCPQAVPNWKLPYIVETSGAVIVGEESCVGERGTRNLTEETGDTVEAMMEAVVDRYFKVDCAIFTPNPERTAHIEEMAKDYNADGVIHYGLQFCQPYLMESFPVERALEEKNIPTLRIETDYGMEDVGQLKTRIEAFIEQLR
ncbi:double-cubane-cluster-containing anaerobic reductase [Desulfococcus multivorans]|uniref:2-hydroxyglutaryl-CoA dehydratase D-component n=1 Tax=Desulfococcus multivorans DSM 2059 TaxID=1121405 RepID=S7TLM1_DESML|nr:double-cubane-cluster-containing anaerobic reductase [Desulfococcus multivorans]AOY58292.1 HgdB activator of 2-hydroxyglutaryl-CoA dehydratase, subunit beta [Desulfococcus multivorans]AQV00631.1 3-hydroxyacyl-ACP dehydratase [Desulfococcus multivorans]EPR37766.1 2-hydroxyglutaryl-CoA dehydratase D-component [Desulfococcus multivorans DSM 2059]MDX9818979.1 double-cubane-cluster-containing anaerobic reductase [Desulfococcus multivorans]SJZ98250.1 Benzoyl-CoA reductase/2-hydroxyglutaryl-CoA de